MDDGKPTERMHQLIAALQLALGEMEAGKLGPDALDQATDDAQALYERLVILRHKAREARLSQTGTGTTAMATDPQAEEMSPMQLDTRPVEVPSRQTSLIDAIAELGTTVPKPKQKAKPVSLPAGPAATTAPEPAKPEAPKAKPVAPAPPEKTASLADKLEHAPISDLHKAIALSQKFWFVAELFNGQRDRYEKAIDGINKARTLDEARALLEQEVRAKLGKPPDQEAMHTFTELVERRFK